MKPELSWYIPDGLSLHDLVMDSLTSTYKSSLRFVSKSILKFHLLFSKEDERVVHLLVFLPVFVNTRTSTHGVSQGLWYFWSTDAEVKLTMGNEVKKEITIPPTR